MSYHRIEANRRQKKGDINTYKFVTSAISVSWQNRRRGQSLVAHGRISQTSSKIICFIKIIWHHDLVHINRIFKTLSLPHCVGKWATIRDSTSPQVCRYTTLWNINVRKRMHPVLRGTNILLKDELGRDLMHGTWNLSIVVTEACLNNRF